MIAYLSSHRFEVLGARNTKPYRDVFLNHIEIFFNTFLYFATKVRSYFGGRLQIEFCFKKFIKINFCGNYVIYKITDFVS